MRPEPEQLKLKMSNQIETIPKETVTTPGWCTSFILEPEAQSLQVEGQPGLRNKLHFSPDYKKRLYLLINYLKLKRQYNSGHSFETALCMVAPTCNFSIRDIRGRRISLESAWAIQPDFVFRWYLHLWAFLLQGE